SRPQILRSSLPVGCSAESVGAFLDGARGTEPRHGWRPLLHLSPRTEVRGTAGPPRVKPARGGLLQRDTLPGLEHRFGLVMGPLTGDVLQKFGNVCGLDRFRPVADLPAAVAAQDTGEMSGSPRSALEPRHQRCDR